MQVPNTLTDPIWSLQPWPVVVQFAGGRYEIPALPAVEWLQHLMNPKAEILDLFPGMLPESEQDAVNDALFADPDNLDRLYETCLEVIATVSGRPWWVTLRLVEVARVSWHTLGATMLQRGVDATRLSFSGWLDVLLLTIMNNIDPKEAMMFTLKLELPPPEAGVEAKEPEMSRSEFMSMA